MKKYLRKDPNLPTLTVITPAYNQADFLRDTIESVLLQDYPNIEYVILDDGSSDSTAQILADYSDKVVWESQSNMGQTLTINKGWGMTNGEIITWLNSDDTFYDSTSVRVGIEHLLKNPEVGIAFGDTMFTEADGTEIGRSRPVKNFTYPRFIRDCENLIAQPSAFIRRDVLRKIGDLDPKFYYFMDWDFWLRAGIYFEIVHIDEILSTYRMHAGSKTVAQSRRAAPELEYMYKKYFARGDIPPQIRAIEKEAMMNMYFTSGGYYMNGGDPRSARNMARKALRTFPKLMGRPHLVQRYLYCFFGHSLIYNRMRSMYHGMRVVSGSREMELSR